MTASQFLGAFNDNAFKALVLFLAASLAKDNPLPWVADNRLAQSFGQALPQSLFALPFVLFGPLTGSLADRISKTRIVWWANALEIFVMMLGCLAFILESYTALMVTVFCMGSQSALFGPAKYGIIKELVGPRDLARANSLIQATTMLAILSGMFMGGILVEHFGEDLWRAGAFYIGFATVGWAIALRMEKTPAFEPNKVIRMNPWVTFLEHWAATGKDRALQLAILSSAFFYMMASLFIPVVIAYGAWLGLPEKQTALLNAMTGIGVILGAWLAGRVSGDRVESRLIPIGLAILAGSTLLVLLDDQSVWMLRGSLLLMGLGSGLFTIPIRCLIQGRPRQGARGSIQGLAEVMDFVGILLAGGIFLVLEKALQLTPPQMFLSAGIVVAGYVPVAVRLGGAKMETPEHAADQAVSD